MDNHQDFRIIRLIRIEIIIKIPNNVLIKIVTNIRILTIIIYMMNNFNKVT